MPLGAAVELARSRWAPLALFLLLAAACESEPPPAPTAPAPAPTGPAPVEEGAPRDPAGGGEVACEGASDDPPQIELFTVSAAEGSLTESIRGLEALAGEHPGSATARVRLGELSLRTEPPQPEAATRWFDRALALHAEGCALDGEELWRALEGAALGRMMQGDYAGARPLLERSLARWPDVPATRYNLACARCQTGDVDGCATELERVMRWSGEVPPFLRDQVRTRDHYAVMARTDPDLAPLRRDAARFESALAAADADPAPR